jgi:L-rhamnose-H+ transport protein
LENMFLLGLLLVIVGGFMEGAFSLGLKMTPGWKFENTWGMGSLIALIFVPWPVALLTVPNLYDVYAGTPTWAIVSAILFGIGWGVGGIFWGLGVMAVGLALAISLMMGLTSVVGSAGPLLLSDPGAFLTTSGQILIAGLIIMILGVIICANAGSLRSKELSDKSANAASQATSPPVYRFGIGLIFCILAGTLSSLLNFGFAVSGGPIMDSARSVGTPDIWVANAVWALVFTANFLVNFLYSVYLMVKNKTMGNLFKPGMAKNWGWAFYLGLLWPLGVVLYGIGAHKLGDFGAYAGFPLLLICSILGSNLLGALTGEWKGTSARPKSIMAVGISVLVIAAALFGYSNILKI